MRPGRYYGKRNLYVTHACRIAYDKFQLNCKGMVNRTKGNFGQSSLTQQVKPNLHKMQAQLDRYGRILAHLSGFLRFWTPLKISKPRRAYPGRYIGRRHSRRISKRSCCRSCRSTQILRKQAQKPGPKLPPDAK